MYETIQCVVCMKASFIVNGEQSFLIQLKIKLIINVKYTLKVIRFPVLSYGDLKTLGWPGVTSSEMKRKLKHD